MNFLANLLAPLPEPQQSPASSVGTPASSSAAQPNPAQGSSSPYQAASDIASYASGTLASTFGTLLSPRGSAAQPQFQSQPQSQSQSQSPTATGTAAPGAFPGPNAQPQSPPQKPRQVQLAPHVLAPRPSQPRSYTTPQTPLSDRVLAVIAACRRPDERGSALAALYDASQQQIQQNFVDALMPVLVDILLSGETMPNFVNPILEMLLTFITRPSNPVHKDLLSYYTANSKDMAKDVEVINALLNLLELRDFHVKYNTIQVLRVLLEGNKELVQESIMKSPQGVIRLVDALNDRNEAIRNDLLLLFTSLTDQNEEIQKIVVFNGVIDHLIRIISSEGGPDGGIVVVDTLTLMTNMLKNNANNQKYFREMGYFKSLSGFLQSSNSIQDFSKNKVDIFTVIFNLLETLIQQGQPSATAVQDNMKKNDIVNRVIHLALSPSKNPQFRTKCLDCLIAIIKEHVPNQSILRSYHTTMLNDESMESGLRLLDILFHSDSTEERACVLEVLEILLSNNPESQLSAMASLMTAYLGQAGLSKSSRSLTAAQLLLFGPIEPGYSLHPWHSSNICSWMLSNNHDVKEMLLRVRPSYKSAQTKSYMNHLTKALWAMCAKYSTQVDSAQQHPASPNGKETFGTSFMTLEEISILGIFVILCLWMDACPRVVASFLQTPVNIGKCMDYAKLSTRKAESSDNTCDFVDYISGLSCLLLAVSIDANDASDSSDTSSRSIVEIIDNKLGMEIFYERLDNLCRSGAFENAKRRVNYRAESIGMHDAFHLSFIITAKNLYERVRKRIQEIQQTPTPKSLQDTSPAAGDSTLAGMVRSYSDIIQSQDRELNELRQKSKELEQRKSPSIATPADMERLRQQLHEETEAISVIESEIAQLEAKRNAFKVEDYELTIEQLGNEMSVVVDTNGHLEEKLSKVKALEEKASQKAEELRRKLLECKADSEKRPQDVAGDARIDSLEEAVKMLQQELQEKQALLDGLRIENEELLLVMLENEDEGEAGEETGEEDDEVEETF